MKVTKITAEFLSEKKQYRAELKKPNFLSYEITSLPFFLTPKYLQFLSFFFQYV